MRISSEIISGIQQMFTAAFEDKKGKKQFFYKVRY